MKNRSLFLALGAMCIGNSVMAKEPSSAAHERFWRMNCEAEYSRSPEKEAKIEKLKSLKDNSGKSLTPEELFKTLDMAYKQLSVVTKDCIKGTNPNAHASACEDSQLYLDAYILKTARKYAKDQLEKVQLKKTEKCLMTPLKRNFQLQDLKTDLIKKKHTNSILLKKK